MRRLLPLPLLVSLVLGPASAQTVHLRLDDAVVDRDGSVMAERLISGLHPLLTEGDDAADAVILYAAIVEGGGVDEVGRSAKVALRADHVGDGPTLGAARVELPSEILSHQRRMFPGDMAFPGDRATPTRPFVGGTVEVGPDGLPERALVRLARTMDAETFASGRPMIIFFVGRADGQPVASEVVGFRTR